MVFHTFTKLRNQLLPNCGTFSSPQKATPHLSAAAPRSPYTLAPGNLSSTPSLRICLLPTFHSGPYSVWLSVSGLSLGSTFSGFIHTEARTYLYFIPFTASLPLYGQSIVCLCHRQVKDFFFNSFYFLAIMSNVAINIRVQVSAETFLFFLSARRGVEPPGHGVTLFTLSRSCETLFQSGCTALYSRQQI